MTRRSSLTWQRTCVQHSTQQSPLRAAEFTPVMEQKVTASVRLPSDHLRRTWKQLQRGLSCSDCAALSHVNGICCARPCLCAQLMLIGALVDVCKNPLLTATLSEQNQSPRTQSEQDDVRPGRYIGLKLKLEMRASAALSSASLSKPPNAGSMEQCTDRQPHQPLWQAGISLPELTVSYAPTSARPCSALPKIAAHTYCEVAIDGA